MKIAFITWMLIIMVFSILPNFNSGVIQLTSYKLTTSGFFIHLFSYFIATLLCSKAFRKVSFNFILTSVVIISLYGILLEVVQLFLPYRTFNYYDILANFVGIALGTAIFVTYSKSTVKQAA